MAAKHKQPSSVRYSVVWYKGADYQNGGNHDEADDNSASRVDMVDGTPKSTSFLLRLVNLLLFALVVSFVVYVMLVDTSPGQQERINPDTTKEYAFNADDDVSGRDTQGYKESLIDPEPSSTESETLSRAKSKLRERQAKLDEKRKELNEKRKARNPQWRQTGDADTGDAADMEQDNPEDGGRNEDQWESNEDQGENRGDQDGDSFGKRTRDNDDLGCGHTCTDPTNESSSTDPYTSNEAHVTSDEVGSSSMDEVHTKSTDLLTRNDDAVELLTELPSTFTLSKVVVKGDRFSESASVTVPTSLPEYSVTGELVKMTIAGVDILIPVETLRKILDQSVPRA